MNTLRYTTLLILACALSACGFYMRGKEHSTQTIDAVSLTVDQQISVALEQKIRKELELFNVRISADAAYHLVIHADKYTQRRVASSRTSFTDRYITRYAIDAELKLNDKTWPLNTSSERLFEDDRNIPTGKSLELQLINTELQEQVIQNLTNQVRSFKSTQNN